MNFDILVFLFSVIFALYLHETNALLYKLQTTHQHPEANILLKDLNARKDLIYLFMTPPTTKFAHISMPALQILCYLRMTKIPFYTFSNHFLLASPTGKPQFAQINGQIYENPDEIIKEIEKIEAEKIEAEKSQKISEKSKNEIEMVEEALDTMQNIIHADLLTSSKIEYDGLFHEDGFSQLEFWMRDDGLKEQMFLALTKIDEMNGKETGEIIDIINSHDEYGKSNLAKNKLKFMEAYFNIKNREPEERDIFFVTHGRDFMHFHKMMEVEENEEEEYEDTENELFEIADEVIEKKKKNASLKEPLLHSSTSGSQASNKPQQKHHQSDRERFEELMNKRVEERLARELAKLKMSIVEFSKALNEKTIQIPVLTEEEEKMKRKEKEKMEKQIEIGKNKKTANPGNILHQRVDSIRQAPQTLKKGLGKLSSAIKKLQSGKLIRQFIPKKMANCREDELVEAFKHAVDVLAPIVKTVSNNEQFLFDKKATATEARLLATLNHLFNSTRSMLEFIKFMLFKTIDVPVSRNSFPSLGQSQIGQHGAQFDWVKKRFYHNKNLQILSEYFEMHRDQLRLDVDTLNALRKRPWSLEGMTVNEQKYSGPYPFKTDSMEWLPQWADNNNWSEPQKIEETPLDEKTAGPDHKLLTKILAKIAFHFMEKFKGSTDYLVIYISCRTGLMHIVASYLCKGTIKLKKGTFKFSINSKKEKECSEWHLKEFYKLNSSVKKLLEKLFVPMRSIIDQTIEETIGFDNKILETIKLGMIAQEKGMKGKRKMDESVESNFMLDLF